LNAQAPVEDRADVAEVVTRVFGTEVKPAKIEVSQTEILAYGGSGSTKSPLPLPQKSFEK